MRVRVKSIEETRKKENFSKHELKKYRKLVGREFKVGSIYRRTILIVDEENEKFYAVVREDCEIVKESPMNKRFGLYTGPNEKYVGNIYEILTESRDGICEIFRKGFNSNRHGSKIVL